MQQEEVQQEEVQQEETYLKIIDIDTNELIERIKITKWKWRENSLFYNSYLHRWNNDNDVQQSISVSEINCFLHIAYFFETGTFLNPKCLHASELMMIMQMSAFLGADACLQDAFDRFMRLCSFKYPTLDEVITVSKADYFVNLQYSGLFYHRFVLEQYERLNSVSDEVIAKLPFTFVEALLNWNNLIVDNENDVVLFVLKWLHGKELSEQEKKTLRLLVRVCRLSLPFINQVLKKVPFIQLTNKQFYTLQNFKSNEQYFEYNDSMTYFEDVFPKEWLLGYRSYVRFGPSQSVCALVNDEKYYSLPEGLCMQTYVTIDAFRQWNDRNDDKNDNISAFVVTLQTHEPYCGFYWNLDIAFQRNRRVCGILTCWYDDKKTKMIEIHIMACVSVWIGSPQRKASGIILHTNRVKHLCLRTPTEEERVQEVDDWCFYRDMFCIDENNGLVVTATIDAMDM